MRNFFTYIIPGQKLQAVKTPLLTSSHNLPPSEAKTRERGVCWGRPRPRQVASPPAPLLYDLILARSLTSSHNSSDGPAAHVEKREGARTPRAPAGDSVPCTPDL